VQRPIVLANIRAIRARHPHASPDEVIRILERHYLTAVTTGGAAVGASAVIPGVGVAASLALSGVETVGFLETSALFAQSVTEVHGIAVTDPERARALVMTMILGTAGGDLVKQLAGQAGGGKARSAFWGEYITKGLPKAAVGPLTDRVKKVFVRRFIAKQGAGVIGRVIPFGVGAVVGGTGSHLLGRQVVKSSREAFGTAPATFTAELAPRDRSSRVRREGGLRLPFLGRGRDSDAPTEDEVRRELEGPEDPSPADVAVDAAPAADGVGDAGAAPAADTTVTDGSDGTGMGPATGTASDIGTASAEDADRVR
jgi:hypothetical protein